MGISDTLRKTLAKLDMRATGDHAKTTCGNLQLCAGLESGIEGATHAVGQWKVELVRARRREEAAVDGAYDAEEEGGGIEATLNNFTVETAGT